MSLRPLALLLAVSPWLGGQTVQEFQLPTGLTCLLLENHERPLIRLELTTRWNPAGEPALASGELGFLAAVLETSGAGRLSRADLLRGADDLGLVWASGFRQDGFSARLLSESRSQEPAFEFLASLVFRPVYEQSALEAQRQALHKRASTESAGARATWQFRWALGDPEVLLPPAAPGLEQVDLAALQTLHRRLLRPERSLLAIQGDLSLAQAKELAMLHFGVWGPAPVAEPARTAGAPVQPPFTALVDPQAPAELWVGAPRTAPGRAEVEALLAVLFAQAAQVPGALQLRIQWDRQGPLLVRAVAASEGREGLLAGLLGTLERWRRQGFSAEALNRARIQWRAQRAAQSLHPEALLQRVGRREANLDAAVDAVTLTEINAALAGWLAPAGLRFLLVGADAHLLQAAQAAGLGAPVLIQP